MRLKHCFVGCLVAAMALTGCSSGQSLELANTVRLSLADVSSVTISYDEEDVKFQEGEGDTLVIKEYMTEDNSGYYAKIRQSGNQIAVSEGGKPFFNSGFSRCVAVYLPADYHGTLTVTTTDGTLDFSDLPLSLDTFRAESTAGTVKLRAVEARNISLSTTSGVLEGGRLDGDTIRVDTTSGNFFCESLRGSMAYTTTSGSACLPDARGSGRYRVDNGGALEVTYTEVTGDLSFFNKNEDIRLTLPTDLEFALEAVTKNGSISTAFTDEIAVVDGTASGTIGEHPTVTVRAETKNGNITIER